MNTECLEMRENIKSYFSRMDFLDQPHQSFIWVDEFGVYYESNSEKIILCALKLEEDRMYDVEVPDFVDAVSDFFCCYKRDNVKSKLRSLKLGDTCKTIGREAFSHFEHLQSLECNGVELFSTSMCLGCYSLNTVLCNSIKKIYSGAFIDCFNLKDITLGSVEELGDRAFDSCASLKSVYLPRVNYINKSVFAHSGVQDLSINKNVIQFSTKSTSGMSPGYEIKYI